MPSTPTTGNKCNLPSVTRPVAELCSLPDYCLLDEYWFEDLEYWIAEFNEQYKEPEQHPCSKTYSETEER